MTFGNGNWFICGVRINWSTAASMPVYKVRVKWGKQKFDNVEVNTDEPPELFKMQLYSLSGVLPERQKVMIGGATLADGEWGRVGSKVKDNAMLMMMGSAEELPQAPVQSTKFIEDMSESEAAAALMLPSGLDNFGNTCYMNATLQCLKVVPELRQALQEYVPAGGMGGGVASAIASGLKLLYSRMDGTDAKWPLLEFMQSLHAAVPHFAERDEKTGAFKQQDAHECWSALFTNLNNTLKTQDTSKFVEQYFGVCLQTQYKCGESPEEAVSSDSEMNYQLSCFISQDVRYLHTGLMKGLEGSVEKHSATLGRNAVYTKTSRIARLPAYLTVQFVRFFVGKAPDSDEMVPKKILKDVKFPLKLDVYDMCSEELQAKLLPVRSRFKEIEEKKSAARAKAIAEGRVLGPKQQTKTQDNTAVKYEDYDFPDDRGGNNSGYYDLCAVLTHKGRSSSSGHYLGWVKHKSDHWLKLDDDMVSVVTEDEVLKLSGGGDWHIAYLLLYAPRRLEVLPDATDMETE